MAPQPPKLTIVPYLQAWDAGARRLTVNLLVTPIDDPRRPLSDGWGGAPVPASGSFEGAKIALEPHLSNDPGRVPNRTAVPGTGASLALTMPPGQPSVFQEFAARFALTAPAERVTQTAAHRLAKYLPKSYRRAFSFVRPKTPLAVIDDSYHCALKCPPPPFPPAPPPDALSWGDAFAMMVRQPAVAREAGLIHTVTLDVGATFANGGWLFFTLAAGSDFAPQFAADESFVKLFATRVPELPAAGTRPLFTPVLFPVARDAAGAAAFGSLDTVFGEAQRFDDGFAKIVHARQPLKNDLADDDEDTEDQPPARDAGLQLGWDDEDMVEGLNRAVGIYPDGSTPPDAPTGVAGYRVDVRFKGDAGWNSLCRVSSPAYRVGAIDLGAMATELAVEVYPSTLQNQLWMPAYCTRWQGDSLVADTADRRLLLNRHDGKPDLYAPEAADAVPLRYGRDYEFRVRLTDATGGGPDWTADPVNAGEAPVAGWRFRRAVPARPVSVAPVAPAAGHPPSRYRIARPGIGFPEAEFADAPKAFARLAAIANANLAGGGSAPVEIPDPDTAFLEVTVWVRPPRFDPAADPNGWQVLYRTHRRFPPLAPDGSAAAIDLVLDWTDCARLSDIAWEVPTQPAGSVAGPVPVPTARDVRVEVRGVGRVDLTYWVGESARRGAPRDLEADPYHVPARAEGPVFAAHDPVMAIASVYLQPDPPSAAPTRARVLQKRAGPVLPKRLAAAVGLEEEDGTVFGPEGRRLVFGCAGLKHHLPPDVSSLALTAEDELPHQWISVVRLRLDRDWTWRGLATPSFRISRQVTPIGSGAVGTKALGTVSLAHTVNRQATRGTPDREMTELVFIDGLVPPLHNGLPYELEVAYTITATLETGATETVVLTNHLPVTTPPSQLPRIAAVGHAFSDYVVDGPDYARTEVRRRMLWVEFGSDPRDGRDTYFARVLAQAPDPMLLPAVEPVADPPGYEDPAIDPEMVRLIRPGQADDFAGLSAMQRLIPAADDPTGRFYLIPLPPNMTPDSKELFGFFTYEFRVGHDRGTPTAPFWSTAQGRYGPSLVLEGVQHPPPTLLCSTDRRDGRIEAYAPFAEPVHEGRVRMPLTPNTELWVALYARVMQADGSTRRPIQLDARQAHPIRRQVKTAAPPTGSVRWLLPEVKDLLEIYGLPEDTPLSALAIEVLPEPNGRFADPLGGDLSQVRILRTSPLVEIDSDCCA